MASDLIRLRLGDPESGGDCGRRTVHSPASAPKPGLSRRCFLHGTLAVGSALLVGLLDACSSAAVTANASSSAFSPVGATSNVATTSTASGGAAPAVAAAENVWGSIAGQLGGDRVQVKSIIANPNTDPHSYEPRPTDARLVATARYVIVNGAGYDPWAEKLLTANPVAGRRVLTVADLAGKKDGDNPHLWYSPDYVAQAIQRITADYKALAPADAPYFDQQYMQFTTVRLKAYKDLVSTIKQRFAGVPVGSTESIFVYLAGALGLQVLTPPGFMQAISDGNEPTAAEKATFDQQITKHQMKVFVNNKQNATPDTSVLKEKAQAAGIPIVDITETLDPATASFQDWQTAQLQAMQQALATATGK